MSNFNCREEEIKSWKKFCEKAEKYKESRVKWIFRGHVPGKTLMSSLDRAVLYYRRELKDKKRAEEILLREFKRRYHQYSSDAPKNDDYLEWFSIMQHYGAPTRLLDFTYSPYVAAYFALTHTDPCREQSDGNKSDGNSQETFEVFAINVTWAIEKSATINGCNGKNNFFNKLIDNLDIDRAEFKHYFFDNSTKNFVCPINPFRLTERISLQNSIFMCPGNVNETFKDNLEGLHGCGEGGNIKKLILTFKREEIIKAKEYLYDFNITSATMFHSLEGFARSLAFHPPKFIDDSSVPQD